MNKSVVFLRSNPVSPDARVEKEVNSLINAGYSVKIICWDRSSKYKTRKDKLCLFSGYVDIYRIGIPATYGGGIKKNLIPLVLFQIFIFKWLYKNRNQYQIIHACDLDTALIAHYCAKFFNKKLVYDIFDYYTDSFNIPKIIGRVIMKLEHMVINNANAVIICTEQRKDQIKGSRPKVLEVIYNSPDKQLLNNNISDFILKSNNNKVKIAYVGILSNGRFIKQIADCVMRREDCEFHIGGFGTLHEYFKSLSETNNKIVYYGKLPYDKTLLLESQCDILTAIYEPNITNHKYAAPNKFYEALMLGKPIIAAKNTGIDEIISNYRIGEVIDYSLESFERAISRLIDRKDEWNLISQRMQNIYDTKFSWSKMEKKLIMMYNNLS